MASLGHIAVGMVAARVYSAGPLPRRSRILAVLLWSVLSLSPDADVIGFGFGVRYEDEWGHRGATHSFVFSFALGSAIGAAAPLFRLPAVRTAIAASVVLASHAVLDTFTDGGFGCALLWPFDLTRYFAPWNPIPVAPIGLDFLSPYGLMVATVELVLFAPLVWFALSSYAAAPRWGIRAALVCAWLVVTWLVVSSDPIRERLVGFILREDTEFVSGFSERALRTVRRGQLDHEIRERLGSPFHEVLFYGPVPQNGCFLVLLQGDAVVMTRHAEGCRKLGIERAASRTDVDRLMGPPEERCWLYSRSRRGSYYRARGVCFEDERVIGVIRRWYRD